ncbi:MAG: helix-turn-helix domain-containing protein [Clostridiales bacterium]|jgi:excisionase family DNA binding protein|nr:helix-turn-helix domain-containing protein [Clostridiales bacterium]
MKDEWLNVSEAAKHLGISRSTLYRWSKEGKIPIYKIAGSLPRVKLADVQSLLNEAQLLYPTPEDDD